MRSGLRLAATAAFLVSLVSTSAAAENRTTIQITAVRASNNGRVFDSRLSSLKTELKQLRFRSYNLVSSETRVLHGNGGQCGIELPNGRYLHVTTREHTPNHLRLHILLNQDNRPVVNTYVKLELGSVVLMGGPRDENGTLVITIGSRPWRDDDEDSTAHKKPASQRNDDVPRELPPMIPTPPAPAVSASSPGR
ncbi:MAG: hypothetical protein ABR587_07685 [Candidatus Binatia bacterium]